MFYSCISFCLILINSCIILHTLYLSIKKEVKEKNIISLGFALVGLVCGFHLLYLSY